MASNSSVEKCDRLAHIEFGTISLTALTCSVSMLFCDAHVVCSQPAYSLATDLMTCPSQHEEEKPHRSPPQLGWPVGFESQPRARPVSFTSIIASLPPADHSSG